MAERKQRRRRGLTPPGPMSLFRYKVREPVSLTLTKDHHEKVKRAQERLKLTRADVIGLLIERYADTVKLTADEVNRMTKVEPFQPSKPETIVSAPTQE